MITGYRELQADGLREGGIGGEEAFEGESWQVETRGWPENRRRGSLPERG